MSIDPDTLNDENARIARIYEQGRFTRALELALEIERAARAGGLRGHPFFTATLNLIGACHRGLGHFLPALKYVEESCRLLRVGLDGADHPILATSINNTGEVYRELGKFERAEELFDEAFQMSRRVQPEHTEEHGRIVNNLAVLYEATSRMDEALETQKHALALWSVGVGEEHREYANGLNNLGHLLVSLGRFDEAIELHEETSAIRLRTLGELHPLYFESLHNLGHTYYSMGDLARAKSLLLRASTPCGDRGAGHPCHARSLGLLGLVHEEQGDFVEARRCLEGSLAVLREVLGEDHVEVASSEEALGSFLLSMCDYQQAHEHFAAARAIRVAALDDRHIGHARSLNNLARLLVARDQPLLASDYLEQAGELTVAALGEHHVHCVAIWTNLANCRTRCGQFEQARSDLLRAQDASIENGEHRIGDVLANRAMIDLELGNWPRAIELLSRARTTVEQLRGRGSVDWASLTHSLAVAHVASGDAETALSEMIAANAVDDRILLDALSACPDRQRLNLLRDMDGALFALVTLARQAAESLPRGDLLRTRATTAAYELLLRRKGILLDACTRQRGALIASTDPRVVESVQRHDQVSALLARTRLDGPKHATVEAHERRLGELRAELEHLSLLLAADLPEFRIGNFSSPVRVSDVLAELGPGDALVELHRLRPIDFGATARELGDGAWEPAVRWGPGEYVAFVVGPAVPHGVEILSLGAAAGIERDVGEYRRALQATGDAAARTRLEIGSRLKGLLLEPVYAIVPDVQRLYIAPDGELNLLPFDALPIDAENYLIDRQRVAYLTSGRDLVRAADEAPRSGSLVVADPDFDLRLAGAVDPGVTATRSGFAALPGTAIEGVEVAELIAGADLWRGPDALDGRLQRIDGPDILHIATHGVFRPGEDPDAVTPPLRPWERDGNSPGGARATLDDPMLRSGVVLAGANTWLRGEPVPEDVEDGILIAQDVARMRLRGTRLAVLSACDTGVGDTHLGEGVFGLRRAFVIAGVRQLVLSLWKVPDEEMVPSLMRGLYERLADGERSVSAAFHAARVELKSKFPDPRVWGAFGIQGRFESAPAAGD